MGSVRWGKKGQKRPWRNILKEKTGSKFLIFKQIEKSVTLVTHVTLVTVFGLG